MTENLKKYLDGLEKLRDLHVVGEVEEADEFADGELDILWNLLTEEEIHILNGWNGFQVGNVVKSKLRTEAHPLRLMVVESVPHNLDHTATQFSGVVLQDDRDYKIGDVSNNWNTEHFEAEKSVSITFVLKGER